MVGKRTAGSQAQRFRGSTVSSGEHVVTVADPLLAYTVPAGQIEKVHVLIQTRILTAVQNLRYRIAGLLVLQHGASASELAPPVITIDLGIFVLNAGETVSCTTSNVGTEGATAIMTVSVLESVPTS